MNQDPDKSNILLESAVLYWHKSFVRPFFLGGNPHYAVTYLVM